MTPSKRKALVVVVVLAVAGLAILLAVRPPRWFRGGAGRPSDVPEGAPVEESGHLGGTATDGAAGRFVIRSPYLRRGDEVTVVGLAELPGRPLHAAFVLLLKLPPSAGLGGTGGAGAREGKSYWYHEFPAAGGASEMVRYEVEQDGPTETISFGGQRQPLEGGRLFLVDLTAKPAWVAQRKAELGDLPPPSEDPGSGYLRKVTERLRERHRAVRDFLAPASPR
jgi:hypothetical protein